MKAIIALLVLVVAVASFGADNNVTAFKINAGVYQINIVTADIVSADIVTAEVYRDSVWVANIPDARGFFGTTLQYYTGDSATTISWITIRPTFDFSRTGFAHGKGGFTYRTVADGESADTLGDNGSAGTKRTAIDALALKSGVFSYSSTIPDSIPTTTAGKRYLNYINTTVTGVPCTGWWVVAQATNDSVKIVLGTFKQ